jgi:hypothetical protein
MRLLALPLLCSCLAAAPPLPVNNGIRNAAADWEVDKNLTQQIAMDPRLLFATLFPLQDKVTLFTNNLPKADKDLVGESQRASRILLRFFVAMAWGRLQYCVGENDKDHLLDWTLPLATALSHGQRVVFEADGISKWKSVNKIYDTFINGDMNIHLSKDPYSRAASSHAFSFSDGVLTEKKANFAQSVGSVLVSHDHGVNLAFGGLGSVSYDRNLVGPCGYRASAKSPYALDNGFQTGHLFILTDDNGGVLSTATIAGLAAGIEPAAFGKQNMWGAGHDSTSGTKNSEDEYAPGGGDKMQRLLPRPPAKYGGMWVIFNDPDAFETLNKVITAVDLMSEANRMSLLWGLLYGNAAQANALLKAAYLASTARGGNVATAIANGLAAIPLLTQDEAPVSADDARLLSRPVEARPSR